MGVVLIMGLEESNKDVIIEVLLEDRSLPKFNYASLKDIERNKKDLKGFLKNFNREVQDKTIEAVKAKENLLVNSPVTIYTEKGFVPVLSHKFFEDTKPDALIIIEETPELRLDKETRENMKLQQEVNREYTAQYSSDADAPLKIIKIKPGNIKQAIKEAKDIIKSVMA